MNHSTPLDPNKKPSQIRIEDGDIEKFFEDKAAGKLGGRLVVQTDKDGTKIIRYKPSFWFFHRFTSEFRLTEIAKLVKRLQGDNVDPRFVGLFERYNQAVPKKQISSDAIDHVRDQAYKTLLHEARGGEDGTSPISGARLRELLRALSPDNRKDFLKTMHLAAIASQYRNSKNPIDPEAVAVLREYNVFLEKKISEQILEDLDKKLLKQAIDKLSNPQVLEQVNSKDPKERAKYSAELMRYPKALSLQSLKMLLSHAIKGFPAPKALQYEVLVAIAKQEPLFVDDLDHSTAKSMAVKFYANQLKEIHDDKSMAKREKMNRLLACMAKLTVLLKTDSRYKLDEEMKKHGLSTYCKYFPNHYTVMPDRENLQDILTIIHNTCLGVSSRKIQPLYDKLTELLRPDYRYALETSNKDEMHAIMQNLPWSLSQQITKDFVPKLRKAAQPPQ